MSTSRALFSPSAAFAFNSLRTEASSRAVREFRRCWTASRTALYEASRSAGMMQQIVSGFKGFHGGAADIGGIEPGEAGHIESVGHDDSLEAELHA